MPDLNFLDLTALNQLTTWEFVVVVGIPVGLAIFAVMFLLRSLFTTRDKPVAELNGHSLRRQKTVFDQEQATDRIGRLNQGFDRLVLESGLNLTPTAAALMLVAWGILVGGIVLLIWDNPLSAVAAALLGLAAMLLVLILIRRRRMNRIREEIPFAADLLARGVRAGESLDQAIAMVGSETGGPLGGEFKRCSQQLDMGRSMTTVMRSLTSRVRMIETRVLASTLIVHRRAGGNLPLALERMAQTVRDRANYRRQMKASTGAARTSAIIIASITPVLFLLLFLWQPDHIRELIEDQLGRTLLLAAVVLEIIGIYWVIRLLRND
jgi:tight adherence protein B